MIPKIHLFFARETFFCCCPRLTQAFSSRLPRFKDHNSIKRQSLVQKGSVSFVIFLHYATKMRAKGNEIVDLKGE